MVIHGSSAGGAGGNYKWNYSYDAIGGGAGNPVGASKLAVTGGNGTGGLLVIFCRTGIGNGRLISTGTSAPSAENVTGGSSGGGSVNVFFQKETNSMTWTTTVSGGAGGSGTATIGSVATGRFVKK